MGRVVNSEYWDKRYRSGGDSGDGSKGDLARWKADHINGFIWVNAIKNVIEFGCGDGLQLSLYDIDDYIGFDVSAAAVELCKERTMHDCRNLAEYNGETAELALSVDVIFHLVDDAEYRKHLDMLFGSATRYVMIYSSNITDIAKPKHIKHRRFTDDVPDGWELLEVLNPPGGTFCQMFVYGAVK